jgi:plastocyanin
MVDAHRHDQDHVSALPFLHAMFKTFSQPERTPAMMMLKKTPHPRLTPWQCARAETTAIGVRLPRQLLLSSLVAVALLASGSVARAAEPAAIIEMDQLKFRPEKVTIKAGETVEWRNTSRAVHTVTADPQKAANMEHVQLPESAESFNSGSMRPGATFRYSFTVPGTYRYFCIPHQAAGIIGEVVVEP